MRSYRNVVFAGFGAVLLWRTCELLFLQSADGYYIQGTGVLRLVLPVLFAAIAFVASRAENGFFEGISRGANRAVRIAASVAVAAISIMNVLQTVYAAAPYFSFSLTTQAEKMFMLRAVLSVVMCVLGVCVVAWLNCLDSSVRGYTFFTVCTLAWFWLRALCAYINEPVNPYNSGAYVNILVLVALGLAVSKSTAHKAQACPQKSVLAMCAAAASLSFGCALPDIAARLFAFGNASIAETVCSLLLGAVCLLLAQECACLTKKEDVNE